MAGNETIDGIEANEASNPVPANNVFRINPDNVEEFKVTTSNPTPEEGKNAGLNVTMATRSGGNDFHISAVEYFRNTVLNANEVFANAQKNPRTFIQSNQYGFDVSGPMLARARQSAPADLPVDFVLADATVYPFDPASFDLLASRFGVMFFADPALSFANMRKALQPCR